MRYINNNGSPHISCANDKPSKSTYKINGSPI